MIIPIVWPHNPGQTPAITNPDAIAANFIGLNHTFFTRLFPWAELLISPWDFPHLSREIAHGIDRFVPPAKAFQPAGITVKSEARGKS